MKKYLRRPFQEPDYEINSNCQDFFDLLSLQYGSYIIESECENPHRISVLKKDNDNYLFEHSDVSFVTKDPFQIFYDLLFNMTVYDDSVIPLHGAAVEYNGRAYIFLASAMTGKTTLTVYLINSGFSYITEDCVLIDKQTFTVYPYNCPIHLRVGGFEIIKQHGIAIHDIKLFDTPDNIRYVYMPSRYIKTSIPLGGIFFITRSEAENSITDMSASESIIELMKSSITIYNPTAEHIKQLSQLSRINCKRLIYRDMEYVKDIIIRGF